MKCSRLPSGHPGQNGFTLIELMVAVAIIALLAALALPSYHQYSMRAMRSAAQGDLLRCALAMERFMGVHFTYGGSADEAGLPRVCPPGSPASGGSPVYQITVSELDDHSYTLLAQPVAGALGAGDGALRLRSNGERQWDRLNDGFDDGDFGWQD